MHHFQIFRRVTPVALGVQVAQKQFVLQACPDGGHRAGNFARHKGLAAPRGFVVEKDAIDRVHTVTFAVVYRHPVSV